MITKHWYSPIIILFNLQHFSNPLPEQGQPMQLMQSNKTIYLESYIILSLNKFFRVLLAESLNDYFWF